MLHANFMANHHSSDQGSSTLHEMKAEENRIQES
jgi:hypothetical protein